jgi:hypothetical protein
MEIIYNNKHYSVRDVGIKPKEIQFDKEGKEEIIVTDTNERLTKVRNPKANGEKAFIYKKADGTIYKGKTFNTLKGVVKAGFTGKSTAIQNIEVKDLAETLANAVVNEHTYYLVGKEFKKIVSELGNKCLVARNYVITRGFKAYRVIIYYNKAKDRVIMKCTRSDINDISDMPENEDVTEVEVNGVVKGIDESEIVC